MAYLEVDDDDDDDDSHYSGQQASQRNPTDGSLFLSDFLRSQTYGKECTTFSEQVCELHAVYTQRCRHSYGKIRASNCLINLQSKKQPGRRLLLLVCRRGW
jgi:hypothetical protein